MILWKAKARTTDDYTIMSTPSTYKVDWEDLDNKSYRSIATGNLIDTVVSKKWSKISFTYNHINGSELNTLLSMINNNPVYIYAEDYFFSNGYIEAQFRCSKASCEMLEDHYYKFSFNLVQKKKVTGQ